MSTALKARFLQGPENSCQVGNGAGALTVGDLITITAGVAVAAADSGLVSGIAGEDMAISASLKKMLLLVPGSLWLFQKGSGTSINVGADVGAAGSGLVDGGTSSDKVLGYRVNHGQEDTTHVCVLIWPHTMA